MGRIKETVGSKEVSSRKAASPMNPGNRENSVDPTSKIVASNKTVGQDQTGQTDHNNKVARSSKARKPTGPNKTVDQDLTAPTDRNAHRNKVAIKMAAIKTAADKAGHNVGLNKTVGQGQTGLMDHQKRKVNKLRGIKL